MIQIINRLTLEEVLRIANETEIYTFEYDHTIPHFKLYRLDQLVWRGKHTYDESLYPNIKHHDADLYVSF